MAVDGYGGSEYDSGFVPPPTTNNRMEMMAHVQALRTLHTKLGSCEVEIVSDSQYVVLGCQNPERARNVNLDIWEQLDSVIQLHSHVQWRHVRGHFGVKWNEQADKLAVAARRGGSMRQRPFRTKTKPARSRKGMMK